MKQQRTGGGSFTPRTDLACRRGVRGGEPEPDRDGRLGACHGDAQPGARWWAVCHGVLWQSDRAGGGH